MKRQAIDSSNLASIGYDTEAQTLEVEFKKGDIYQYYNIPQSIYNGLMTATSHGQYFERNIKKYGYKYKKVQ